VAMLQPDCGLHVGHRIEKKTEGCCVYFRMNAGVRPALLLLTPHRIQDAIRPALSCFCGFLVHLQRAYQCNAQDAFTVIDLEFPSKLDVA